METGEEKIDTEKSAVRRGAEFGVMWPEAEDGGEPQEAGGGGGVRKDPPLEEGAGPLQHFDFRLLASRPGRGGTSVVVRHPVCGVSCGSPRGWGH